MIPNIPILTREITDIKYPGKTYKINLHGNNSFTNNSISLTSTYTPDSESEWETWDRVSGYVDALESVIQAIYLILNTERYKFIIYSWDYGVELVDLFGKPMPYCMAVLPRRIKEALIQDNRISDVIDFEFEPKKNKLFTTFTVITDIGNVNAEMEVSV